MRILRRLILDPIPTRTQNDSPPSTRPANSICVPGRILLMDEYQPDRETAGWFTFLDAEERAAELDGGGQTVQASARIPPWFASITTRSCPLAESLPPLGGGRLARDLSLGPYPERDPRGAFR